MEQEIDGWTRRLAFGDDEDDLDAALEEGHDLVWIRRKFTTSQQ